MFRSEHHGHLSFIPSYSSYCFFRSKQHVILSATCWLTAYLKANADFIVAPSADTAPEVGSTDVDSDVLIT
jgi:hypothetical protein